MTRASPDSLPHGASSNSFPPSAHPFSFSALSAEMAWDPRVLPQVMYSYSRTSRKDVAAREANIAEIVSR